MTGWGGRYWRPLRRETEFEIGENTPYQLDETDYTAVTHCARRNLAHVQIEVRQDLIGDRQSAEIWAERLARAIEAAGLKEGIA